MRLVLISPLETTSSILCSSTKIFSSHYIPTILVWNKKCCGIISTVFKCTIGLQLRYLRVDPTLELSKMSLSKKKKKLSKM